MSLLSSKTKTARFTTLPRKTTQRRASSSGARWRPSPRTCTAGRGKVEVLEAIRESATAKEDGYPSNCSPERLGRRNRGGDAATTAPRRELETGGIEARGCGGAGGK